MIRVRPVSIGEVFCLLFGAFAFEAIAERTVLFDRAAMRPGVAWSQLELRRETERSEAAIQLEEIFPFDLPVRKAA